MFRQLIVAFILECRYQRERAAAPSPWEDTRENREDWLDDVIAEFFEALGAEEDEPGGPGAWTDEAACDECGDDIVYPKGSAGDGAVFEDSDGACVSCGAKYTLCVEPETGEAWSNGVSS